MAAFSSARGCKHTCGTSTAGELESQQFLSCRLWVSGGSQNIRKEFTILVDGVFLGQQLAHATNCKIVYILLSHTGKR